MADATEQNKVPTDGKRDRDALPVERSAELSPETTAPQQLEYRFHSPRLPLAVYREVAAHLRQIDGVNTGLLPQTSKEFDYLQSQTGGLWIRYKVDDAERCQPQVETILTYYGDRYGQWETLSK